MFGYTKCVKVYSNDGEHMYYVPKKDVYKPLTKILDNSQISEFFDKFINECLLMEEPSGEVMSIPMIKLMFKLKIGNFLEDLNEATDQETGKVDWDKFFSNIRITVVGGEEE